MHRKKYYLFIIFILVLTLFFYHIFQYSSPLKKTLQVIIQNKDGVSLANKACFLYESLFISEFLTTKNKIITHAWYSVDENETIITINYFSDNTKIDGFSINLNGEIINVSTKSNDIIYLRNINNSFIYECQLIIHKKMRNGCFNGVALSFKSKNITNYTYIYSLEEIKNKVNNLVPGANIHSESE